MKDLTPSVLRTPTAQDLPEIATLLEESELPTGDLHDQQLSLFLVGGAGGKISVVGGLERCRNTALIRSIATSAAMRSRGLAGDIIVALENLAEAQGFDTLYLLTETAEGFFEARGYVQIERSAVPEPVRASQQFSSLCPGSATVMFKTLGD